MGQLSTLSARIVPPVDVPDGAAFEVYARASTSRNVQITVLVILVSTLSSWIFESVIYRDVPAVRETFFWLRAFHTCTSLVLYFGLRLGLFERFIDLATIAVFGVSCVALGAATGTLGGLNSPWFHYNYAAFFVILIPVVALPRRILYAASYALGLVAGYVAVRPEVPHAMVIPTVPFMIFVTVASVTVGHAGYLVIRRGFESDRAQQRSGRALAELNETLEQRVRQQTYELRLLADHLERAREDERTRIARDLHDELGQELTALRYCVAFLRQRFERDPASIRGNLDELESLLGRSAATTRQMLMDLRPRILDDLGLDAGVEWLLKRTEEHAGLRCRLVTRCGRLDVDVNVSIAAFRILQESLTNVVKHAQATHVDVEVSVEDAELRMSIRDDGIGMPEAPSPRAQQPGKGGMGLIGMRERVGALGGTLQLVSSPGGGTTIRVHLPTSGHPTHLTTGEVSVSP